MEIIKIESENGICAEISSLGAELVSLKRGNNEYLWQGDPDFWAGQSPLLFPNTGRYWDNRYRYEGKLYEQAAHGFARRREFDVIERTTDKVVLGIHSDDKTLEVYPFPFFLFVTYRIDGDGLCVEWFVRNEGDKVMFFQIGAHPAFNLPDYDPDSEIHGYFSFAPKKGLEYFIPLEKGCIDPEKPVELKLGDDNTMPITARTFDIDTYVIESGGLSSCTLMTAARRPWVTVEFNMPVLALWAPTLKRPDCPFVCIEPWCGSCDTIGFEGDISERRHEFRLEPAEHFTTAYRIRIH